MGNIIISGQGLNLRRSGGAGRYGAQLVKFLKRSFASSDIRENDLFFNGADSIDLDSSELIDKTRKDNFSRFQHVVKQSLPPALLDYVRRTYGQLLKREGVNNNQRDAVVLPNWLNCGTGTLIHELTNYGVCEFAGRMSLNSNCRVVVTFLDIQDFFYPENFSDSALLKRRLAYSYYKDRAELFFAISHFTKQTLIDRLGIPENKILVTYLAADDFSEQGSVEFNGIAKESHGRFWLYPAKVWKHKNHDMLLRALGMVRRFCREKNVKLILTGGFSLQDLNHLRSLSIKYCVDDLVEPLGFVSDTQLLSLFRCAEYMIFPSAFEGFGMPVLEAMAFGCPVLSSNAASLPEIGGDAAFYFNADRVDDIASLMEEILNGNGPDRDVLISKGYENVRRFSWEKTYFSTVEGYKTILDKM